MNNSINWPLLAAVRFFLAFIVLSAHLSWYFPSTDYVLKLSKFGSFTAVLGFLVLSGFSIAASYTANKQSFYYRRCLRIVPVYFACIFFTVVVMMLKQQEGSGFSNMELLTILGHVFFLEGIVVGSLVDNPVLWTLIIEVFFYIITPLIRKRLHWLLPIVVLSALFFMLQRYIVTPYYSQMLFGTSILFLGWAWLVGFWFYYHRGDSGAGFFCYQSVG